MSKTVIFFIGGIFSLGYLLRFIARKNPVSLLYFACKDGVTCPAIQLGNLLDDEDCL